MPEQLTPYQSGRLEVDVLRDQIAPDASNVELEYFAKVCRHLDLDPWADQIVLIGRKQKFKVDGRDTFRLVHKPQITVAGRRAIAARTGRLRGIAGPEYCGPRRLDAAGERLPLEWLELWDDDSTPPYAARVLVYVDGWDVPANGTAKWVEFKQTSPWWTSGPSHMLGKTAEALALRRAFPEVETAIGLAEGPGAEPDADALVAEANAVSLPQPGQAPDDAPERLARAESVDVSATSGPSPASRPGPAHGAPGAGADPKARGLCSAHRPVPHLLSKSCVDWLPLGAGDAVPEPEPASSPPTVPPTAAEWRPDDPEPWSDYVEPEPF
jgi:hypothetical protein